MDPSPILDFNFTDEQVAALRAYWTIKGVSTMSDEKTICPKCQRELQVGDYPYCGKNGAADHEGGHYGVVGDDIPGGVWVRHGICNEDGSPRRYDTKSSMAAEAKRRGLVQASRHVDGDKHLSRWV